MNINIKNKCFKFDLNLKKFVGILLNKTKVFKDFVT